MPKYNLNKLGDVQFERLVQSILKKVIGAGTTTFGAGPDGAREATFEGSAPYPSSTERWKGNWIFQVKFHDTDIVPANLARNNLISEAKAELNKVVYKYKYNVNNFILITNVPLSGVHGRGTIDRFRREVFASYKKKIPHLHVWGADEIYGFLEMYPQIRRQYIDLLITGDVIAELLTQVEQRRSDRATTLDMFLRAAITREESAQLDQAGDVSEDAIPLQQVFFDLYAYIPTATRSAVERLHHHSDNPQNLPMGGDRAVAMVSYLINRKAPDRVVIVGGPGEGKSTIGQYLAQLHRATLLGKSDEIAISEEYVPDFPRLPFRVVLKDFAQWLADYSADSNDSGSLDTYISQQVTKLSTRQFSEKELHETLKTNPAVLILDGLDEVTDAAVRRRLLLRVLEFIDRCTNTLHSDIQIIATTRPTNYSDQFDPKSFLHFRLSKLEAAQVRDYVKRWTAARVLEEDKAIRLQNTIEECLRDNQISLLMTTPLQVTILILIINSGGTPPRQREALFNDYLEVIYKREKAKGLGIVKTEKELLIGLHKFVGYLLHEEATKARTSSATLVRSAYDQIVFDYLRGHDPYSPDDDIEAEWHAITVDAGERLVLIVESPANIFGFELRSIQEFFAACYLLDTSSNTDQRYERFSCIAYLPHWRNVALFFAGRVGRNYTGEAANVIEVCKDIDRHGPDLFVRRGAELALELAAERALGPNRNFQRSLLEYGLSILDGPVSTSARKSAIDIVKQLPDEDIRDHVLPILEKRLPTLGYLAIVNACQLLVSVAPQSAVLAENLLRIASEAGGKFYEDILAMVSFDEVGTSLRINVIHALLAADVDARLIGDGLPAMEWSQVCSIATELESSNIEPIVLEAFVERTMRDIPYLRIASPIHEQSAAKAAIRGHSTLAMVLQSAESVGKYYRISSSHFSIAQFARADSLRKELSEYVPAEVKTAKFDNLKGLESARWILWLAHLLLGNVTASSWGKFTTWMRASASEKYFLNIWAFISREGSPIASIITNDWDYRSNLEDLTDSVTSFTGSEGLQNWISRVNEMEKQLSGLHTSALTKVALYGPGILESSEKDSVTAILDAFFDRRLQPIAFNSVDTSGQSAPLSGKEFDRHSEWFSTLPVNDPWRRRSIASRIASQALRLGRVRSPQFEVYLDVLDDLVISSLAVQAALDSDDQDLAFLLSKLATGSFPTFHLRQSIINSYDYRRRILLRLLAYADKNENTRNAALKLVEAVCQTAGSDEARPAIRSTELNTAFAQLASSQIYADRVAGISLYVVRPPRSKKDWNKLQMLLHAATAAEVNDFWRWVIPASAQLSNEPSVWIAFISSVLEKGPIDELSLVLIDALRDILPRESQSLVRWANELNLPSLPSSLTDLVSEH